MATFNLAKTTSAWAPDISSYKMTVEITSAEDAPREIFVIKRTRDFVKDQFEDVFAAVATPVQLEDFPIRAPRENSSYYRTNVATLIVRTAEGMQAVFDSMVYEIKKLALDLEALNNGLSYTSTYQISGDIAAFNHIEANQPAQKSIYASLPPYTEIDVITRDADQHPTYLILKNNGVPVGNITQNYNEQKRLVSIVLLTNSGITDTWNITYDTLGNVDTVTKS
jgi:hypothetical protein